MRSRRRYGNARVRRRMVSKGPLRQTGLLGATRGQLVPRRGATPCWESVYGVRSERSASAHSSLRSGPPQSRSTHFHWCFHQHSLFATCRRLSVRKFRNLKTFRNTTHVLFWTQTPTIYGALLTSTITL